MAVSRRRIRIKGIVQGVGFRPTVWRYATALSLGGTVWNEGGDVLIEIEGEEKALDRFVRLLQSSPPPLARITSFESETIPPLGSKDFSIDRSAPSATARFIAPDMATCRACLEETFDPNSRRYRYPFTNCTDCGPRYTIIKDLPYDRPRTSMAGFPMCADCRREYENPGDRRFHAQPIACPKCGPQVEFHNGSERLQGEAALGAAVRALQAGAVLAVKGLGGYHLACLAEDEQAVLRLRSRKRREAKPFAIMVPDTDWAEKLAVLNEVSRALLTSPQRPIVLVPRREGPLRLPEALAPGLGRLGIFLPYTPLHAVLLHDIGRPLVMTSGNISDEPICYKSEEAEVRLGPLADAFLHHNRPIVRRCEDSVCSVIAEKPVVFRRARGYAPAPIPVRRTNQKVILAVGGHLKNTFCILRDSSAFVSPHVGDLHHASAYRQFLNDVKDFLRLLDVTPQVVAYDMHPDYATTHWAEDLTGGIKKIQIQHHHAHVVSCMAEHGHEGPVLGVAFDGLGMGLEGELWGGEFLLAYPGSFKRLGSLEPVLLPGGERAIRECWRVAAACLYQIGGRELLRTRGTELLGSERIERLTALLERGAACVPISSAGRLFDCMAAICGLALQSAYEGEAAMRLEDQYDDSVSNPGYLFPIIEGDSLPRISWRACVEEALEDIKQGADPPVVSSRFHRGLAASVRAMCVRLREETCCSTVALSGGVFQNKIFTELVAAHLKEAGFEVLLHRDVPPGDGGISLGQALAAERMSTGNQNPEKQRNLPEEKQ